MVAGRSTRDTSGGAGDIQPLFCVLISWVCSVCGNYHLVSLKFVRFLYVCYTSIKIVCLFCFVFKLQVKEENPMKRLEQDELEMRGDRKKGAL